ncbi:glutathione S-transferase family protein [Chondromyces crocatus]|uniref:Glutathione S-transferase n=1 Tax=Chondromyces crocatus TaxID=52 RepID=A0A0K1EME4_CHOCO|nr:glutathione S-transferase family protein [Chondromyces crocatus]AKT41803.1 uncharacterized protein CMC5_060140 [Chondromyces crocatus]
MTRLHHLPFSPWSEKARWALDHHRVSYETVQHVPLVGDMRLRVLLRKPRGRVTVPILEDQGQIFPDSLSIARHAEAIGTGTPLFPAEHATQVQRWHQFSEELLNAGRGVFALKQADDVQAAQAALPRKLHPAVRSLLAPVARQTMNLFVAKYRIRDSERSHRPVLERLLEGLATVLSDGRQYLVGEQLTYADLAVAPALQMVRPVDKRFMPVGPGGRKAWSNDDLAERFPQLLAWRDALYEAHRS